MAAFRISASKVDMTIYPDKNSRYPLHSKAALKDLVSIAQTARLAGARGGCTSRSVLLSIRLARIHNAYRTGGTVGIRPGVLTLPLCPVHILQATLVARVLLRDAHLLSQTHKDGRQDCTNNDFIHHVSFSYLSPNLFANAT